MGKEFATIDIQNTPNANISDQNAYFIEEASMRPTRAAGSIK
jgi:hypothetical protein